VLPSDLLKAEDPDNASGDLVYSVLHQGNKGGDDRGWVERLAQPGVKLDTFTQADLDSNSIVYVHKGTNTTTQRLPLQVSDLPLRFLCCHKYELNPSRVILSNVISIETSLM